MDSTIIAALIGAAALITGILLRMFVVPNIQREQYKRSNKSAGIDIIGQWSGKWQLGDQIYEDSMHIQKWVTKNQFEGFGYTSKGKFFISGEVDSSRLLIATYKGESVPTQSNIGVLVLELWPDGQTMEGYWAGRSLSAKGINWGKYILEKR
ncbi:hypothetical protein ACFLTP_10695 [Chloroflexota bacterium]